MPFLVQGEDDAHLKGILINRHDRPPTWSEVCHFLYLFTLQNKGSFQKRVSVLFLWLNDLGWVLLPNILIGLLHTWISVVTTFFIIFWLRQWNDSYTWFSVLNCLSKHANYRDKTGIMLRSNHPIFLSAQNWSWAPFLSDIKGSKSQHCTVKGQTKTVKWALYGTFQEEMLFCRIYLVLKLLSDPLHLFGIWILFESLTIVHLHLAQCQKVREFFPFRDLNARWNCKF